MPEISSNVLTILGLLRDRHNVLISGPPGTGKSLLLSEVAQAFTEIVPVGPVHVPGAPIAIPRTPPILTGLNQIMPSPEKTNRKVFHTVFHQNMKYRDFLTGLAPVVDSAAAGGGTKFHVVSGTLYRASEHAKTNNGASLIIIDEINRGPAVQIFGGSIVAIESDKRLAPDGTKRLETQFFEITEPATGNLIEYALPHHLYILAAMNQADTSVEALDVAFLRRWIQFRLEPSSAVLRKYFQLPEQVPVDLPDAPTSENEVNEAAVRAWSVINKRIRIGRGAEFQIGHGVLMTRSTPTTNVGDALQHAAESWQLIRAHIDEVFFGDIRGIAAVLNVGSIEDHPYVLEDTSFADEPRLELIGPEIITPENIFPLLRAISS